MSATTPPRIERAVPPREIRISRPAPPPVWLVATAFAVVYLVWGSTYLGIRIAIESVPPFLMAGGRFVSAGAILYAVMRGLERVLHFELKKCLYFVNAILHHAGDGKKNL